MDIKTARIANARLAIERAGGVKKVSTLLGYANASFLSQMFGPNPTRDPSEKTTRRLEDALGVEPGAFDQPPVAALPQPAPVSTIQAAHVDAARLAQMISLVNRLIEDERASVNTDKFATLVSIAYEDAEDHDGQPRESRLRQVVQLFR